MQRLFPTNNFVPPKRGAKALCAIGEAPGETESQVGEPFVGKAGAMLDGWFASKGVGIPRHDLWMTNVLSCRPPSNHFPTDFKARAYISSEDARASVRHCLDHHLFPFLHEHDPWDKVYLIGAKALEYIAEKGPLFEWGGTPLPIPRLNPTRRVAVATIHPAALMRDPTMLPFVFKDLARPLDIPPEHYSIRPSASSLAKFFGQPFVIDIETNVPPTQIDLVALSNTPEHATVVDYAGEYLAMLRQLAARARVVITQNGEQFDLPMCRAHGMPFSLDPDVLEHWDLMLCHHVLWPPLPHDLGSIARQYLTKPYWKDWRGEGDLEEVYAARDADGEGAIYVYLRKELERYPRLKRLYQEVQLPLARICHLMTTTGIMTDPAAAAAMAEKADGIVAQNEALLPEHMRSQPITKRRRVPAPPGTLTPPKYGKSGKLLKQREVKWLYETYEVAGPSPWKNGPQTAAYLYGELGLKEQRDSTGKVTTGKTALAILGVRSGRPEVGAIREARKWSHRKKICEKLAKGHAKRVHASFNVHGTNTFRLSSTGGDEKIQMQNLTEDVRVIFVPSQPGWKLISLDFSQMEARLAAWFAKDTARAARFDQPGYNEYKHAASIFLGVKMEDVIKEKSPDAPYHKAKIIVLGTDRALGARKISITNDIPEAEVKEMQRKWKSLIPATIAWQERIGNQAKRDKELWSPFGYRGRFWGGNEYCVTPETLTLTSDLRWVPVGTLKEGDTIVGFDEENAPGRGAGRKFRKAVVESTGRSLRASYRIITDQGVVTATSEHGFLVQRRKNPPKRDEWVQTRSLVIGDRIRFLGTPWVEDTTKEAGWLAGFLDGEGNIYDGRISASQKLDGIRDRAVRGFLDRGYKVKSHIHRPKNKGWQPVDRFTIAQETYQRMRLLGSIRPQRLLEQAEHSWCNRMISCNRPIYATVLDVKFVGPQEIVPLSTSTRTLLTNGLFSHNTEGISFLPQNTGAAVIARCMIALMYERVGWPRSWVDRIVRIVKPLPEPARLLLQVHDELVFEAPSEMVPAVVATAKAVMEQEWEPLEGLSLPVSASFGDNWLEMEDC